MKQTGSVREGQTVSAEQLLTHARQLEPQMIARLRGLVAIESPSSDKAAVDRAAALVAEWTAALGGRVRTHRFKAYGNSLEVRFGPRPPSRVESGKPVLLLGHLDTVWPIGTLRTMPFKLTAESVSGPGVFDMKSGVVMMLTALEILQEQAALRQPVIVLLHGDEEIGSPASRALTEKLAQECAAVYVLEPAHGVASHAGVDFTAGHSAIVELGRQLEAIGKLTDLERGITVNPGVIGGGTASNVIAAEAWAEIDVRVATSRDGARIHRALTRLRPYDKACRLELTGGLNRPPMVRSRRGAALFRKAQQYALQMGLTLEESATGGGSDGNFTAALGIPTLDGMGPVGAGAHAPHEHLVRAHLAERTALLAAMLL
jgi:glutamate carboxypeptidase